MRDHARHADEPYPGGENGRQAIARVARWRDNLGARSCKSFDEALALGGDHDAVVLPLVAGTYLAEPRS